MDQVRELLFGSQVKEIEEHLKKQEDRIMRELDSLREEVRQSLAGLESKIGARLESETKERGQGQKRSEADLSGLKAELEKRLAELNSALNKAESELRQSLADENGRISATLEDRYKHALSTLSEHTTQIRQDMVDRGTISGLLSDLAAKIGPSGRE